MSISMYLWYQTMLLWRERIIWTYDVTDNNMVFETMNQSSNLCTSLWCSVTDEHPILIKLGPQFDSGHHNMEEWEKVSELYREKGRCNRRYQKVWFTFKICRLVEGHKGECVFSDI